MANYSVSGSVRSNLVSIVTDQSIDVAKARVRFFQEFLLAKAQSREGNHVSDKMAEAMAIIATNDELTIQEAKLFAWKEQLKAAKDD